MDIIKKLVDIVSTNQSSEEKKDVLVKNEVLEENQEPNNLEESKTSKWTDTREFWEIVADGTIGNPDLVTVYRTAPVADIESKFITSTWQKFMIFANENNVVKFSELKKLLGDQFKTLSLHNFNREEILNIFYIFWRGNCRMLDSKHMIKEYVKYVLND